METEYRIFIGYRDAQSKSAVVSVGELNKTVADYFARNSVNFSIVNAEGGFLYGDGDYECEATMIITIIGEQNLDIEKLARGLAMYMNQEKLIIVRTSVSARYS